MKGLISIIVPVYNTERYLDRCIESVCNQTYQKLEIILLDDGSTDGSLAKCLQWQHDDERIIVVHKKNEKQGPTRDLGVKMASGEYLLFVDSDDWIERDYAELLYTSASSNQADIAFCDFDYITEKEDGGKTVLPKMCPIYLERAASVRENSDLLYLIAASLWNKIFRSDLWRKAEILQHTGGGEDACVCVKIIPMANKLSQVRKILYHYCYNPESTTNQLNYKQEYLEYMKIIRDEQKRRGWGSEIDYAIKKMVSSIIPYNAYSALIIKSNKEREFLRQYFVNMFEAEGDIANANSVVWGSFNLRCVVKEVMYFIPDSYMFSSLISLMSPDIDEIKFRHVNAFRKEAVEKEMKRAFLDEMFRYEYIFLDFMEERYDIFEISGNRYITKSEAFISGIIDGQELGRVIYNGSEEYMEYWKESCRKFSERLKANLSGQKIVMVRTRLAEWYGGYGSEKQFGTAEECRRKNQMFQEMENYFVKCYPNAIVIENKDNRHLYTEKLYPYGCQPWHLNEYWYSQMGKLIGEELKVRKDFRDGQD